MLTNQLITDAQQAEKFVKVIEAIFKVPRLSAEGIFMAERDFFTQYLDGDSKLRGCEITSIMNVFLDVLTNELTFSPATKLVYMEARWTKINGHPQGGENRLTWKPSPFGKVYLCQRAGSISHVTDPELVVMGDVYYSKVIDNMKVISHSKSGTSNQILLGYCFVVLPNGAREAFEMTLDEFNRLKKYNPKNPLYTSGPNGSPDPGFFKAKVISFAVKYKRSVPIRSAYLITTEGDVEESGAVATDIQAPPIPAPPVQQINELVPPQQQYDPSAYVHVQQPPVQHMPPVPPVPQMPPQYQQDPNQYQQVPQAPSHYPDPNQQQYAQPQYMPPAPPVGYQDPNQQQYQQAPQMPQMPGIPGLPAPGAGDSF